MFPVFCGISGSMSTMRNVGCLAKVSVNLVAEFAKCKSAAFVDDEF